MQDITLLAALDLGSNSFRLEIGRFHLEQLQRIEYIKETVRQGNGLDKDRNLSLDAMQRGWDCLARFGERIAHFRQKQVRAVATQTLREARNKDEFLQKAQAVLGFPIDVISGKEEARLIYLGVSHLLPQSSERRLVIDIGGRSTELIIGQGYTAQTLESYRVGSVAWSMKYFGSGDIYKSAFTEAETAAKAVLDEGLQLFSKKQWDTAYGSSGTIGAVADLMLELGQPLGVITRMGLAQLKDILLKAGHIDRVKLDSLREDRRAVLCGGLAVLCALFDLLGIDTLFAADGALRHGVLYDMVERSYDATDVRSTTIKRMMQTFAVDADQAKRVSQIALHLFRQLEDSESTEDFPRLLRKLGWAADLHEIGSHISHADYHKHGAYILDNAEAMGFAQHELHRLSQLILGQKGKLRKLGESLGDINFAAQLLCLRVAVISCHARAQVDWRQVRLTRHGNSFVLTVPQTWQQSHPQSVHLLQQEVQAWSKTHWRLNLT
jgi:exopolyphosphatase/guanosine-5'-triphosphate,3'-diphosphate pyrophosphatase